MQTELVDVSSGTQLWGDQYKGKLDDILGLQEEIAQQVSQKLRLRLSGAEKTEISKHTTQKFGSLPAEPKRPLLLEQANARRAPQSDRVLKPSI
jgi:hypothetical protein